MQVYTPTAEAEAIWRDFKQAQSIADLILRSADYAAVLGSRLQRAQQLTPVPPVLRLPAADAATAPVRETIQEARASLGLS